MDRKLGTQTTTRTNDLRKDNLPVEGTRLAKSETPTRRKTAHFMCGTPFWGLVGAAACSYFAYTSISDLRAGDVYWQHGWWTAATWTVWVVLIAGLLSETLCRREQIFFALMLVNFAVGLAMAAWATAPEPMIRSARKLTVVLWFLGIAASLSTVLARGDKKTE